MEKVKNTIIVEPADIIEGFDKHRDVCDVDQFGFVFLPDAYANRSIPAELEVDDMKYNGIEDPKSILGTPKDVFDVANMRETLNNYSPPSNNPSGEAEGDSTS